MGRGLKRAATSAQLAAKRRAVHDEYQALAQTEAEQAHNQQIMEVVRQLTTNPDKLGAVMLALRTTADADAAEERKKMQFPKTYVYLYKVPKEWLVNHTLPAISERLTPALLNKLCKADRRVDLKLLNMATGSGDKAKIWSYYKASFDDLATKHHCDRMNSVLSRITWDSDHKISWHTCGLYTLIPETATTSENDAAVFTGVRCNALTGSAAEVFMGPGGATLVSVFHVLLLDALFRSSWAAQPNNAAARK